MKYLLIVSALLALIGCGSNDNPAAGGGTDTLYVITRDTMYISSDSVITYEKYGLFDFDTIAIPEGYQWIGYIFGINFVLQQSDSLTWARNDHAETLVRNDTLFINFDISETGLKTFFIK